MTITLHLPAAAEHKLESLARQNGQSLETFVGELLKTVSSGTTSFEAEQKGMSEKPLIVDEGGIHVVYAEATGDLDAILQRVREERIDHIGSLLES